jgi:hypothetical protein
MDKLGFKGVTVLAAVCFVVGIAVEQHIKYYKGQSIGQAYKFNI